MDQGMAKVVRDSSLQGAVDGNKMSTKESLKRSGQVVGHTVNPPGKITAFGDVDIVQGLL